MLFPLRTKDLMTLGNILCGFFSVLYALQGDVLLASYMILFAWGLDALDGTVAKALKQANRFGGEFDNVADLISYSMAPSFLVYAYFLGRLSVGIPWLDFYLVLFISSLPLAVGCVRFARNNWRPINLDGAWVGYPRPASALLIIGVLNSHMVQVEFPGLPGLGMWLAAIVVIAASMANMAVRPVMSHHGDKWRIPQHVKVFMWWLLASLLASLANDVYLYFNPFAMTISVTWDVVAIWLLNYAFTHQRMTFTDAEWANFMEIAAKWRADAETEVYGASR